MTAEAAIVNHSPALPGTRSTVAIRRASNSGRRAQYAGQPSNWLLRWFNSRHVMS